MEEIILNNGKKTLFYQLHLDFREKAKNSIGGTQAHVHELTKTLCKDYNVIVAARDRNYFCVTLYTENSEQEYRYDIGAVPLFPVFRDAGMQKLYEQIFSAFHVDLVHVHHTQDLSLEVFYAAEKMHLPILLTVHDFYYVCPTITLVDHEQHFCGNDPEVKERCIKCLQQKKQIVQTERYLEIWRREAGKILEKCSAFIFPSESARNIFAKYYPQIQERSCVIAHGENLILPEKKPAVLLDKTKFRRKFGLIVRLDEDVPAAQALNKVRGWYYHPKISFEDTQVYIMAEDAHGHTEVFHAAKTARPDIVENYGDINAWMSGFETWIDSDQLEEGPVDLQVILKCHGEYLISGNKQKGYFGKQFGKSDRLNVAFLGGIVPQKGSETIKKLISIEQDKINWFLLGGIGDRTLFELGGENCFFSGIYHQEDLPALIARNHIDVVCMLPIWAETFSYVLSEAWMCKTPVVGTDIGAIGERIRKENGGWLVAPDASPEQILDLLMRIQEDKEAYLDRKNSVLAMKHRSVEQMCEDYVRYYQSFLAGNRTETQYVEYDEEFIRQGQILHHEDPSEETEAEEILRLTEENEALAGAIAQLEKSAVYRAARKVAESNIPLKEPLKKVIRKLR